VAFGGTVSSDSRWTGGAANREWQRGTRHVTPLDPAYLKAQIFAYLADCYANRGILSPAHHPTEAGALRVIYHQGPLQAAQVRAAWADR
jgi:hypothetical protein